MKLLKNVIFGIILVLSAVVFSGNVQAASVTFDAKALAVKAVNNELSEGFIKSLSYDEFISIAKEVAISGGADIKGVESFFQNNKKTFQRNFYSRSLDGGSSCSIVTSKSGTGISTLAWGSCSQHLEDRVGSSGATYAYYYTIDWGCDGDWSDSEYRFDYYTSWIVDPNLVKWWSLNPYYSFWLAVVYPQGLLGLNLCSNPKSLCVGANTITYLFGGPLAFKHNVFIWHQ